MDTQRRKELMEQYKNARPPMGVVCLRCTATGESFLGPAKNIKAEFNGLRVKLDGGTYPNRHLQDLWNQYGPDAFEESVVETLDYEDGRDDYADDLKELRDLCLERDPSAAKIWR